MRVVLTGTQADVAACVAVELTGRDHEVIEAARGRRSTGAAADAVVHVAGTGRTAGAGAGAILGAARTAAVDRVLVISPAETPRSAADGLLRELHSGMPGVDTLLIRTAPVLGRATTGATRRRFAGPVILGVAGRRNALRFVHHDDLARFAAEALEHPEWTGRVDLAAGDVIALREVAAIIERPYAETYPGRQAALWGVAGIGPQPGPDRPLDVTRLARLGFVPVWSSRDCVIDFRRTNRQNVYFGARRVVVPWRFPWTATPSPRRDGPHRHPANGSGLGGEFDTTVDPDWPEFTCANVAEAFPGPMTPLSLELAMEAMRATGTLAADIVQMSGGIRRAVTEEHVGCFGHTIYVNLTVSRAASAMLPGADPAAWRDFLFGTGSGVDEAASGRIALWGMIWRLPKIVVLLAAAAAEARRIEAEARDQQRDAAYYSGCTDDELHSRLSCARDAAVSSWAGAALGSAGVVPIMALIERWGGKRLASQFRGGVENLVSAGLLRGTYDLAEHARADPSVVAALRDAGAEQALERLRADHPRFAEQVDDIIAEYGHRGPSETELSCPVFADAPGRLLDAVAKLAASDERPMPAIPWIGPGLRLLARLGAGFQQSRERARDAAMRYTHDYRLIARELGSRLADRGVIEGPDDVFYLIRDELVHPPGDAGARISRRKAERTRLGHCRPPTHFVEWWEPRHDTIGELKPGESLTGIPASAGSAKGPVRTLTVDSIDDLQPGEVLVAECTDTGWTPFFGYAAAVVVDTGAEMSHAAVIAREFGIPCVVGSAAASRILRTGQVIEVDGSTGRITRLE